MVARIVICLLECQKLIGAVRLVIMQLALVMFIESRKRAWLFGAWFVLTGSITIAACTHAARGT